MLFHEISSYRLLVKLKKNYWFLIQSEERGKAGENEKEKERLPTIKIQLQLTLL